MDVESVIMVSFVQCLANRMIRGNIYKLHLILFSLSKWTLFLPLTLAVSAEQILFCIGTKLQNGKQEERITCILTEIT
ncbi:hypothetical protein T05_3377 [Trichinella murrelli]|uniref:Uncharacterized protein n=1 Tax=Trichinella murrelli TaxID=144512 RepID=A0A0V0UDJ8_9BILA|nr:hypothetical protein T05_3377 [Trichinella murrelli]